MCIASVQQRFVMIKSLLKLLCISNVSLSHYILSTHVIPSSKCLSSLRIAQFIPVMAFRLQLDAYKIDDQLELAEQFATVRRGRMFEKGDEVMGQDVGVEALFRNAFVDLLYGRCFPNHIAGF